MEDGYRYPHDNARRGIVRSRKPNCNSWVPQVKMEGRGLVKANHEFMRGGACLMVPSGLKKDNSLTDLKRSI